MADIRVTSTSRVFYQVPDVLAALLREAFPESFAKVEPKPTHNVQPPSNPAAPRWVVRHHPLTGNPELVRVQLNQEERYPGPGMVATAELAQAVFTAAGHPVPTEIIDKFAALLDAARRNDPELIADARERAQNQQFAQGARERLAQRQLQGE